MKAKLNLIKPLCALALPVILLALLGGTAHANNYASNDAFLSPKLAGPPPPPEGEVLDQPICFNVINEAPYKVYGSIMTDKYITDRGVAAHHRSNFRLDINEMTEFCAAGPFFEGRKVELTLRTLVPVFSCKTGVESDVVIHGRIKPEGGTESWADCH